MASVAPPFSSGNHGGFDPLSSLPTHVHLCYYISACSFTFVRMFAFIQTSNRDFNPHVFFFRIWELEVFTQASWDRNPTSVVEFERMRPVVHCLQHPIGTARYCECDSAENPGNSEGLTCLKRTLCMDTSNPSAIMCFF